jgi:hypothetical protein
LQNGFGNGDQDPPGNSGPNNNAENADDGDGGKPDDKEPGNGDKPEDDKEPGNGSEPEDENVSDGRGRGREEAAACRKASQQNVVLALFQPGAAAACVVTSAPHATPPFLAERLWQR